MLKTARSDVLIVLTTANQPIWFCCFGTAQVGKWDEYQIKRISYDKFLFSSVAINGKMYLPEKNVFLTGIRHPTGSHA